jgi:hypothetical protein
MPLSIQSIYQPLNDFFISQFNTGVGGPIFFRFDKFGSAISDEDFMLPGHLDAGYSPAFATETLSTLVNRVPLDAGDDLNVVLSSDAIDDTYYFRFLLPALPYVGTGTDESAKQSTIDAFNAVKQAALHSWENIAYESLTGLMLQYKPSAAIPDNWYDKSKKDLWTHHALQISDSSSATTPAPNFPLWKLKLDDASMRSVLQLPQEPTGGVSPNIAERAVEMSATARVSLAVPPTPVAARVPSPQDTLVARPPAATLTAFRAGPRIPSAAATVALSTVASGPVAPIATASPVLFDNYLQQRSHLYLTDRLRAAQLIDGSAPTRPAEVSSLNVAFDYCVINVRRPWYGGAFVSDSSWYVPNAAKGTLTASGANAMPLMPIGFVAIRNLTIASDWSAVDMDTASMATRFGPFNISSSISNDVLSHEGLQIIGWIVQRMPTAPPNDPPPAQ